MRLKNRARLVLRAIGTTAGLRPQGFFAPYPYAATVDRNPPPYPAWTALFAAHEDRFRDVLADVRQNAQPLASSIAGRLAANWNRDHFGPLDAAVAYAMVGRSAPRTIIEVGSGSSTHVMVAAIADKGLATQVRCIDPVPRADITSVGVTWSRGVLGIEHVPQFAALEPGDIAFFDSSHLLFQGTDVDIIFNRILPVIRPGVVVHIHDIFYPEPYPASWLHREYTEQLGLSGWLFSGAFTPLFSSAYAGKSMAWEVASALDRIPGTQRTGGSLWMLRS